MAQLLGQLEHLDSITSRRKDIWNRYFDRFSNALSMDHLPPIGDQKPTDIYFISAPIHSSIETKCYLH